MIAPIWTKMVDADIITMIPMMSKNMPMAFMVVLLISREQEQLLQRRRGARQRAPFSGQVIADTGRSLLPLAAKSLLIHANRSGRPLRADRLRGPLMQVSLRVALAASMRPRGAASGVAC